MNQIILLFLCTVAIVAFMMLGIGIKMVFKKGATFKKQCSVVDPVSGERVGCTCKKSALDDCKSGPKHYPLQINKEVLKEL